MPARISDEASPRGRRLHAFLAAGGGDHLGRGRLAGGDGGGERIASGQRGGDGGDGARPRLRVLLEAAQDDALDDRVEPRRHRRGRGGLLLGVLAPPLGERRGLEGLASGEELVEHEAERVDVALHGSALAGELLGRHVGGRARDLRAALVVVDADGEAEVGDLRAAAAVDHDVAGLQVAVQHALVVRRGEARAQLARDLDRLVRREAVRCAAAARPGPRRRRTPSRGSAVPRSRRRRRRGRRWGARRRARGGPRRRSARSQAGSDASFAGRNFSATGWPSFRSSAR